MAELFKAKVTEVQGYSAVKGAQALVEKMAVALQSAEGGYADAGVAAADLRALCDDDWYGRSSAYRAAQGAAITMALGPKASQKDRDRVTAGINYHCRKVLIRRKKIEQPTPPAAQTPQGRLESATGKIVELSDPEKYEDIKTKAEEAGKLPPERPAIVGILNQADSLVVAASQRVFADEPVKIDELQASVQSLAAHVSELHKFVTDLAKPTAVVADKK